ncbi:GNAT family N-acetyltransferase [Pseudotabrizicola alkalilacus]|uniref:N-acetyltransferase n=1 Tax=Pseudotabrizicola alkalilacus TaxID=2305252 RepID=A0A411YYJ4_9RHOB|nr:GNAT family N-acetyltransferase [Pseudotabrizicola alkalilacus]RGP35941.1 N-acetyltransferase [Pseudotabrizicola alkalilacus]
MPATITFDTLTDAHLDGALRLSQAVSWPHRREDWHLFLRLSRGVVALAGGKVVGTAQATPFGDVAMVNMIIVDAQMRSRGLGRQLMTRAMAGVDVPEWRLTATVEGLPLYEKLGFVATGSVLQHQGVPVRQAVPDGVDWAGDTDLAAIQVLDQQATGADRSSLIARLMHEARLVVIRKGPDLAGYACLRRFGRGDLVGPVVAEDSAMAQRLISFLMARSTAGFLRVDTTEEAGLAPWLMGQGLAAAGGGVSMRRGAATVPATSVQCFALAAQALG